MMSAIWCRNHDGPVSWAARFATHRLRPLLLMLITLLWLLLVASMIPAHSQGAFGASTEPESQTDQRSELEDEKLRQEIRKLRLENDRSSSPWDALLTSAPFLGAIVAVAGVVLTLWKQIAENNRQRKVELKQKDEDSLRRFDENFTSIVGNLGSDSVALQASAAASLSPFLKNRYKDLHRDVFMVLVANLKIDREIVVRDTLTRVFEIAIRKELDSIAKGEEERLTLLDLSRAKLVRANLESLDFSQVEVDFAFADLTRANLTGAQLPRVDGFGVILEQARVSRTDLREARLNEAVCFKAKFHESNLVSATLKGANLQKAEFQRAHLQEVHFENSDLGGARFEKADVNNAFFYGAQIGDDTMRSLIKALNWRDANFDKGIKEMLEAIAT
jgi:uncharacterized protein YjbI with pentapeptide repeats